MINRYIIKLKPSVFKCAKIGDLIMTDTTEPEDEKPIGFIAEVFKKTKSIEICLFKSLDLDTLNIDKKRILYYEDNYNSRKRFQEITQQRH